MEKPKQLTVKEVKAKKVHHNGYIFVDPNVEVGSKAVVDEEYSNRGYVIVKSLGAIFAMVTGGTTEWSIMRDRLTSDE